MSSQRTERIPPMIPRRYKLSIIDAEAKFARHITSTPNGEHGQNDNIRSH